MFSLSIINRAARSILLEHLHTQTLQLLSLKVEDPLNSKQSEEKNVFVQPIPLKTNMLRYDFTPLNAVHANVTELVSVKI